MPPLNLKNRLVKRAQKGRHINEVLEAARGGYDCRVVYDGVETKPESRREVVIYVDKDNKVTRVL